MRFWVVFLLDSGKYFLSSLPSSIPLSSFSCIFADANKSMLINSSVRASRTTEHAMSSDPTWLSADLCLMSALESIMGIIATCIPSLNPLMAAVLPTLWGPVSEPTPPRNFELTPKDVEELCVQEQFRPDVAFKNHARVLPLYKDAEGAGGRGIMVKVEYEQTSKVTKEKRGRWGRWRMLEG